MLSVAACRVVAEAEEDALSLYFTDRLVQRINVSVTCPVKQDIAITAFVGQGNINGIPSYSVYTNVRFDLSFYR